MGGRSKFSFPIPGRKQTQEGRTWRAPDSPGVTSPGLSKAQRILGADSDLNIDSPSWDEISSRSGDDQSWRRPPSGMSISISESTQSTYESENGQTSERWEQESGVLPKSRLQQDTASSTFLGRHFNDDMGTDSSSLARRLRREDSSSTLKSYYDRQKSPLAISQQTSESSARDMALRKGYPSVTSLARSPLLQVENIDHSHEPASDISSRDPSNEKPSRRKPAKLDLSLLFAKSKKAVNDTASPSSMITNVSSQPPLSGRRRLSKVLSKESLRSQKQSIRSNITGNSRHSKIEETRPPRKAESANIQRKRATDQGTLSQLYEHYEQMSFRSPPFMEQIPEFNVAEAPEVPPRRHYHHPDPIPTPPKSRESRSNQDAQPNQGKDNLSWQNARSSVVSPPWEGSSAASISSKNSKTSRHTSVSAFSTSDLRQNSVLSLSSDSEDEPDADAESSRIIVPISSPARNPARQKIAQDQHRLSKQQATRSSGAANASQSLKPPSRTSKSHGSRKGARATPFLAIPEVSAGVSGTWSPPQEVPSRSSGSQKQRPSKRASSVPAAPQLQPTPPISPSSSLDRSAPIRGGGRLMAVTKQEEALLEALRQKRANMREKIIKEHERGQTPPDNKHEKNRQRFSVASSVGTVRSNSTKEEILLYLDTPTIDSPSIEPAEPSPDLSDFLSFGSDADTTPRSSRAQTNLVDRPRPNASVSPDRQPSSLTPLTPPTAVRLSAVGSATGFRDHQSQKNKKRDASNGVRFVDESRYEELHQNYAMEVDNEPEIIWGISGRI